jgi:hypothetical protein
MRSHLIMACGIAALLTAAPASAQILGDWDTDQSGVLSGEEWRAGLQETGLFADWDADTSGRLNAAELGAGLFERFDDDDDGVLSVAEWDEGVDAWYGERTVNFEFANWDKDGNGVLSEAEFVEAFDREGLYTTFTTEIGAADAEAGLEEDELLGGLFDWFDEDEDEELAEAEAGLFEGWFD